MPERRLLFCLCRSCVFVCFRVCVGGWVLTILEPLKGVAIRGGCGGP